MNLKPLGDRLIVEVLEEEELTVSDIVLPDTAKEKSHLGPCAFNGSVDVLARLESPARSHSLIGLHQPTPLAGA